MDDRALRVGVYARISLDRDGQQTATARQMQDAREFAARKGWEIADTFEDVDLSAFDLRKKRPEFERMLAALRSGAIAGVLTWKFDRLTRQQRDLARVLEACEPHKGFIASITEPLDTREPHGQFVAELLVAQARMESANTSARQRRKAQEQREKGLPPTNGRRTFGYRHKYEGFVEEEAAVLREVRDRLFAGEHLHGICLDLNARGFRSTAGNGIRAHLMKRLLISPTIAGERELEGRRYPGNWPAIITPEDSRRLNLLLNRRPGTPREAPARTYLLSGLIRCGRCQGRMSAHAKAGDYRRYVCSRRPGYPNCGSMSVKAEPLEEIVRELVIAAVNDESLRAAVDARSVDDGGVLEAIRRDEEGLAQLGRDHYVDRVIGREEFFAARDDLNRRLEANRLRLAERAKSNVAGQFVGGPELLRAAWDANELTWRRAVVSALLDHVAILPGKPGRLPFDPERVRPVWKV